MYQWTLKDSYGEMIFDSRASASQSGTKQSTILIYMKEKETHDLIFSWLSWKMETGG